MDAKPDRSLIEMTEPASPTPVRTWRPMVLWTAGILLLLGLAWFVGAVVVPVWQVRDLACALAAAHGGLDLEAGSTGRLDAVERERQFISRNLMGQEDAILRRLGGPEAAAKKLAIYYRMPDQLAPEKYVAVRMMSCCGEHALPGMVLALKDPHWKARKSAAAEIALVGGSGAERTAPAIEALLKDPDARVQEVAVAALRRIHGQDSEP